jgi:hypothetical protein
MANESLVMTAEVRDSFSGTLRKLQNELRSLSSTGAASTKTLQKDWKSVGAEIQGAAGSITRDMLPAMRQGNLAGLALGGSIGLAVNALKNFAQSTSTLGNFSKEIGLAGRELAKIQAMGEFFGIDSATTQGNLRNFQNFLQALKNDGGQTISHLRQMFGRAGDDIARELLKPGTFKEQMENAFRAIRNVDSEPTARKLAQELFGNEAWASAIRNMTPAIQAELDKIVSKIIENKDAADKFNLALLGLKITAQNLANESLGPLLKISAELIDKWKEPIGGALKDFANDIKAVADQFDRLGAFFSAPSWEGFLRLMDSRRGTAPEPKAPTTADTNRKLDSWLGPRSGGGGVAPGAPAKTLEKSNEDLKRSTDDLKRSNEKQTTLWERFVGALGQGGDTAGLGPGLGGVSAGGGGLGGAGVLSRFRDAIAGGGGGGANIRHGATGGGRQAAVGSGGAAVNSWMNFLMKPVAEGGLGRTREQAAGEVASLRGESGSGMEGVSRTWNDPSASGQSGISGGVASWRNERFRALQSFAQSKGLDWRSHEAQQGFYRHEMLGAYSGVNARIAGAQTAQEALGIHVRDFERPANAGAAIGQRSGYINDLRTRNLSGEQAPADLSGLRVKPGATGGGEVAGGVTDAARWMQTNLPGFNRVTSMNDAFHQRLRRNSAHKGGLAVDATISDPRQSAAAAQQIRDELIAKGLDPSEFRVIDEYKRLSRGGTGGHIHTQFNSAEAAERYRNATLLQQQGKAEKAQQSKLEANGTVNIHLNDGLREKNAKVDTDGMFKDVKVNRGRPMSTAEDNPMGRAAAGF